MSAKPLNEVFLELEAQPHGTEESGSFEMRIPSNPTFDIHIGVRRPSLRRTFRLRLPERALEGFELPNLGGLAVEKTTIHDQGCSHDDLVLSTTASAFNNVFAALTTDLMQALAGVGAPNEAASAALSRLARWQRFLEKLRSDGLTAEEQHGPLGELLFMRQYVLPALPPAAAVECWTGPDGENWDFECAGRAFEIKTMLGSVKHSVRISNEFQMDQGEVELYLCCYNIDAAADETTLLGLVQHVKDELSASSRALSLFEDKLKLVGFFDFHRDIYDGLGYKMAGHKVYTVIADFPRIAARSLPSGVSAVSYSINLDACGQFEVGPLNITKLIAT